MTALSRNSVREPERWKYREYTLKAGTIAYIGGRAALNLTTGVVEPMTAAASGILPIGFFAEHVDASLVAKKVTVDFRREVTADWVENATSTDAITAADIGNLAYAVDDGTVSDVSTGRTQVGRIWDVNTTTGEVLVEALEQPVLPVSAPDLLVVGATLAYTSNDCALTVAQCVSGALFDVPTTAANSNITLPDDAPDKTILYFAADGTKNGHTITYRQAGGGTPVALSAATTASRRHLAIAVKNGTKWTCNITVGPA